MPHILTPRSLPLNVTCPAMAREVAELVEEVLKTPRTSCQTSPASAESDGRVEFALISNQDS